MKKSGQQKFDKIALDAIKTFGAKNQAEMLIEECAEVIMAIQKLKRAEKIGIKQSIESRNINFIEEIVDVNIIIKQFLLFDKYIKKESDRIIKHKIFEAKNQRNQIVKTCASMILSCDYYITRELTNDFCCDISILRILIKDIYSNKKNKKSFDYYYKFKMHRLKKRILEYKNKSLVKRYKSAKKSSPRQTM